MTKVGLISESERTLEIAELLAETRELVLETIPDGGEKRYHKGRGYGYYSGKQLVCGVFIYIDRVEISFLEGTSMPDPMGLLSGSGKQSRSVVLEPGMEIRYDGIGELIETSMLSE